MANLHLTTKQLGRFWSRIDQSGDCWIWTGGRSEGANNAVGYMSAGRGNLLKVHRVMYELRVGPIPPNRTVRQTCGDRFCVRPEHLRLGSYSEHGASGLTVEERFVALVDKASDANGCWLWSGSVHTDSGYGYFGMNPSGPVLAHRFAYGPVREGLVIDHLCRNRRCVNPAHLEAVTQRVNMLRGEAPGAKSVREQLCVRGIHPLDVEGARSPDRRCRACYNDRMRRWHLTPAGLAAKERRRQS